MLLRNGKETVICLREIPNINFKFAATCWRSNKISTGNSTYKYRHSKN